MSNSITAKVIEEMNELPEHLQQQVLQLVESLRQEHVEETSGDARHNRKVVKVARGSRGVVGVEETSGDAWDILASLTGTIEAPADWSAEHDHYLYGTPKQQPDE